MSIDYADYLTEKRLNALENRLKKSYKEAYEGMCETWDQYINGYDEYDYDQEGNLKKIHHRSLKERYDAELEKFKSGKSGYKDQAEFDAWYLTQVQRGEKYSKTIDELAEAMTTTNVRASAYINNDLYSIYALNANYQAFKISQDYDGISFRLYSEETVKALAMEENHVEFKTTSVNPQRDYEWNRKQINNALMSGIIQGKSIDKIADSFYKVMGRNRASAIRNARTSYTSAQNAGRQNTAERAQKMGIHSQKQWLAIGDERTRFSHAMLSGQIRDIDQKFSNGLMYPADPEGSPSEVYNCRCKRLYVLPKYENKISNETYDQWENMTSEEQKTEIDAYKKWVKDQQAKKSLGDGTYKKSGYNFDVFPTMGFKILDEKESYAESLLNVNPNFYDSNGSITTEKKWTHNCQRCGIAYEMRQRGYDVEALEKPLGSPDIIAKTIINGKPNPDSWIGCFKNGADNIKNIGVEGEEAQTLMNIIHEMKTYGNGSRAIVRTRWKNNGGHIVNIINDGGIIKIMDSQQGIQKELLDFVQKSVEKDIWMLRVDDLELTKEVKKCVK